MATVWPSTRFEEVVVVFILNLNSRILFLWNSVNLARVGQIDVSCHVQCQFEKRSSEIQSKASSSSKQIEW